MKKALKIIIGSVLLISALLSPISIPKGSDAEYNQGNFIGQIAAKVTFLGGGIYLIIAGIRQKS